MPTRLNPIRIGDSLVRTYTIYNPKPEEEWANPNVPEADEDDPMILTGYTVTWCLWNNRELIEIEEGSGLTVTPLLGKIELNVDEAVTAEWERDRSGNSYINLIDTLGRETSKFQFREAVVAQYEDA